MFRSKRTQPEPEPPQDETRPISVPHGLTNKDLRRLYDGDLFYDPRPLLGFIPQWAIVALIFAGLGFGVGVNGPKGTVKGGCVLGLIVCVPVMALYNLGFSSRRKRVRNAGLCDNRVMTIDAGGVRVDAPDPRDDHTMIGGALPMFCSWDRVREVEDRKGYFFFWLEGRERLILPRAVFHNQDSADMFLRAARWWHSQSHKHGFKIMSSTETTRLLKVKTTADGAITADDAAVTFEGLAIMFSHLKHIGGGVLYYRDDPTGEPHPNAMKVVQLVIENSLPVRMSSKPDFSDVIGPSET